jgi:L-arabinose transport system ATP-binding protein
MTARLQQARGPGTSEDQPKASMALRRLTKHYGATRALHGVDLDIHPGEVLALVGENGAGKSTLLSLLSGSAQPTAGGVELDGRLVSFAGPADARRHGIRVVRQEPEIVDMISIAENLFLGELPRRRGRRLDRQRLHADARAHLATLGWSLPVEALASDLSTGQRQLTEIARALKPGVRVLALDEPTSSLTEDDVDRLLTLVRTLRDRGVAVVYVSHRLREVLSLADRVAVLRDGQLVQVSGVAGLDEQQLVRAMVGRPLVPRSRSTTSTDFTGRAPLLRVRGLGNDRLHDIDLDVHAGEVVGIAGLAGSGRSQLVKAIFGAAPVTTGCVELAGKPLTVKHPADAIAAGLALACEDRKRESLLLQRSIRDNISISVLPRMRRRARLVNRNDERRLSQELMARLRVKAPDDTTCVADLSGGNQQKVVLARWLATTPVVLLLDEPTRGIDVGAKREIYELIAQLAADGRAVVVVSSELPELLAVSDRIVVMRDGRVVGELDGSAADEESVLRLAMVDEPAPPVRANDRSGPRQQDGASLAVGTHVSTQLDRLIRRTP